MVAFPAVWAFTYVSASFWSVLRLHSALAFDAKATPARTIEQTMRVTLTFSLLICACLPGFFASIEYRFLARWLTRPSKPGDKKNADHKTQCIGHDRGGCVIAATGCAKRSVTSVPGATPAADLPYLTLTDVSRRIQSRELSPVDLTQRMLDRIAAVDSRLKSYATVMRDEALAAARAADQEIRGGKYRGRCTACRWG
jgi:hypothetical protein